MHGLVRRTLAGDSNSRCLCSPLSGHQSTLTVPNPLAASSDVFTPVHGRWGQNGAELQPASPRRAQHPSGSPGPAPAWVTRDMWADTTVGRWLRSPRGRTPRPREVSVPRGAGSPGRCGRRALRGPVPVGGRRAPGLPGAAAAEAGYGESLAKPGSGWVIPASSRMQAFWRGSGGSASFRWLRL